MQGMHFDHCSNARKLPQLPQNRSATSNVSAMHARHFGCTVPSNVHALARAAPHRIFNERQKRDQPFRRAARESGCSAIAVTTLLLGRSASIELPPTLRSLIAVARAGDSAVPASVQALVGNCAGTPRRIIARRVGWRCQQDNGTQRFDACQHRRADFRTHHRPARVNGIANEATSRAPQRREYPLKDLRRNSVLSAVQP